MDFLKSLDSNILLLIVSVLIFIVTLLLGIIGFFIIRFLSSVDNRFKTTNQSVVKTAQECTNLLSQIHTIEKNFGSQIDNLRGAVDSGSVCINRLGSKIDKVVETCHRIDGEMGVQAVKIRSSFQLLKDSSRRIDNLEQIFFKKGAD